MRNYRNGQSLIEILVAIGVGTIMLLGAITALAPVIKSTTDVNRSQVGAALGKELLDNVKVFAEANWHNIDSLATTSANKYFLSPLGVNLTVSTGTQVISFPGDGIVRGLIGFWQFDEATGTIANDSSGNGKLGNMYDGTVAKDLKVSPGCITGSCAMFNGDVYHVDVGTSSAFGISTGVSIVAWARYDGALVAGKFPRIFSNLTGSNYNGMELVLHDTTSNKLYFQIGKDNTLRTLFADTALATSTWYHVAATYDGSTGKLFINSAQQANIIGGSDVIGASPLNFWIGGWPGLTGHNWNGSIDEVRIYNRAISEAEVQSIYTNGAKGNSIAFYRYFYVDNVYRNPDGSLAESGGGLDPSTKKITVEYYWGTVPPKVLTVYLTRSGNRTLWQTDWSGGAGIDGPASSTGGSFSTSSGIDFATSTGSIRINDL